MKYLILLMLFPNIAKCQHIPIKKDTTISVNCGKYKIFSNDYNERFKLWYNIRLVQGRDTSKIRGLHSEDNGSDLSVVCSPSGRYFLIDNIIIGYVYKSINDSFLSDNYTCAIVDVVRKKAVYGMQSKCYGVWNKKNQWISYGKVEFDPKKVR